MIRRRSDSIGPFSFLSESVDAVDEWEVFLCFGPELQLRMVFGTLKIV